MEPQGEHTSNSDVYGFGKEEIVALEWLIWWKSRRLRTKLSTQIVFGDKVLGQHSRKVGGFSLDQAVVSICPDPPASWGSRRRGGVMVLLVFDVWVTGVACRVIRGREISWWLAMRSPGRGRVQS